MPPAPLVVADRPLSKSSTLIFDVLGLTPDARADLYRTLTADQFAGLLAVARRDLGTPYGLWADDPVGFINQVLGVFLTRKQTELCESVEANVRTVSPASHSVGKGLDVDTPIPTPTGWVRMGDLAAGDDVLGHNGAPVEVLAAHEARLLDCYRVTFDDHSSIVCDAEHMWTTLDFLARGRIKQRLNRVGTLIDWRDHWHEASTANVRGVAESLLHNGQRSHVVPCPLPLDLPDADLPIAPYTFGLWLGDGTSVRTDITSADPELAGYVAADGYNVTWRTPPNRCPYFMFSHPDGSPKVHLLRAAGVHGNKHIPTAYLRASEQQRRAVLAGLLDADGYLRSDDGSVEITLTAERLAADTVELVRSLGYKPYTTISDARLNGRTVGTRWRVGFRPDRQVFRLQRKANRLHLRTRHRSRTTGRVIVSIEPTVTVPTRCIRVADKYGVFLAGEAMIPTHNTFSAAMLCCWFGCVHPAADTQIVTTAPRMRQVKTLLWPHIHQVHASAGLPGEVDLIQWKMPGRKSAMAYGFAAPDYDEDAVQGIHAPHLLVVVDESGGISHTLGKALESITSGAHTRVLAIGNPPTDEEGSWFEERTVSELWHTVRIAWEDTPNYVLRDSAGEIIDRSDEQVPEKVSRNLVDEQWVKDQIAEFGPDSSFVEARVHARFPKGSTNKTIPWSWIEAALENDTPEPSTWVRLGADPAADGGDELGIAMAVGNTVGMVHSSSGAQNANPTDVAGKILEQIRAADEIRERLGETRPVRVKIDSIGVGWGVAGLLRAWGQEGIHNAEIVDVNVSEAANDDKKFANKRAEMWWCGREMIRPRPADMDRDMPARPPVVRLDLDNDKRCAAQLNAPKYGHDSQGRVRIEKKDEIKKRLGGSPDRAESVLLAMYEPDASEPARSNAGLLLGGR